MSEPSTAGPAGETKPSDNPPPLLSEFWITTFIVVLFLTVCVVSWWLAHKHLITGAPGAPLG